MANPTYSNDIKAAIANGGYNTFEFANEKYYWSAPVKVSARIGYKAIDTSDRSLGFEDTLELDITHSSGGTNGLDCVETADAMIVLLGEAATFVEEIRNDKDAILAAYRVELEARRERDRQAQAAQKAKEDNDTLIGKKRAIQIVEELKESAKTNGRYRDAVKLRYRGSEYCKVFHCEYHYKRVTFSCKERFGFGQISRADMIAEIADMAEVVEIEKVAA